MRFLLAALATTTVTAAQERKYVVRLDMARHEAEKCQLGANMIHIPKAAGSSVQGGLQELAMQRCGKSATVQAEVLNCSEYNQTELVEGAYYLGHAPIGFAGTNFIPMVYIIVIREPMAMMISLYDYTAQFAGSVLTTKKYPKLARKEMKMPIFEKSLEFKDRELLLATEGVPPTGYLDALVLRDDYTFLDISSFLIPCRPGCHHVDKNTAVVLHNLLRIDVVAVVDELSLLLPQLDYHLPDLAPFTMPMENSGTRQKQRLSPAAFAILQNNSGFVRSLKIYHLARHLARARANFAEDKAKARFGDVLLDHPSFKDDYNLLLETSLALQNTPCLVPPAKDRDWPTFL